MYLLEGKHSILDFSEKHLLFQDLIKVCIHCKKKKKTLVSISFFTTQVSMYSYAIFRRKVAKERETSL